MSRRMHREIDPELASWIRYQREQHGLWVHQLAAAIDVNPGRISEYENCKRPVKPEHLEAIAQVLN